MPAVHRAGLGCRLASVERPLKALSEETTTQLLSAQKRTTRPATSRAASPLHFRLVVLLIGVLCPRCLHAQGIGMPLSFPGSGSGSSAASANFAQQIGGMFGMPSGAGRMGPGGGPDQPPFPFDSAATSQPASMPQTGGPMDPLGRQMGFAPTPPDNGASMFRPPPGGLDGRIPLGDGGMGRASGQPSFPDARGMQPFPFDPAAPSQPGPPPRAGPQAAAPLSSPPARQLGFDEAPLDSSAADDSADGAPADARYNPIPAASDYAYSPPYAGAGPYPPGGPGGGYPGQLDPAYNYLSSSAAYYPQPVDYSTYSVPYYNYSTTNNIADGPRVLIGYIINVTSGNDVVTATRGVFPYGTYPAAYQQPPPPRPTNYVPLPPPLRRPPYKKRIQAKSQPIQIMVQAAPPAAPVVLPAPAPAPHPPYYEYNDSGRYPRYPGSPRYRERPGPDRYNDGTAHDDQFGALAGGYLPPADDQWGPGPAPSAPPGKANNAPYNYYRSGRR